MSDWDRNRQGGQRGDQPGRGAAEVEHLDQQLRMFHRNPAMARALHKRYVQRKAARKEASSAAKIPDGGGAPLASDVRERMEGQLGTDLSGVKVHTGGESAQAAEHLGARAFTVGQEVHFGSGEFAPGTQEGDRLLAHELTHTVQAQKSGVQRKAEPGGQGEDQEGEAPEVSQPGDPSEQEADGMAEHAVEQLHGDGDGKNAEGEAAPKEAAPAVAPKPQAGGLKVFLAPKTQPAKGANKPPAGAAPTPGGGQFDAELQRMLGTLAQMEQNPAAAGPQELAKMKARIVELGAQPAMQKNYRRSKRFMTNQRPRVPVRRIIVAPGSQRIGAEIR